MDTKKYTLKSMPDDIRNLLLEEQLRIKQKRNTLVYSIESTIYAMLRDYTRIRETKNNKQ